MRKTIAAMGLAALVVWAGAARAGPDYMTMTNCRVPDGVVAVATLAKAPKVLQDAVSRVEGAGPIAAPGEPFNPGDVSMGDALNRRVVLIWNRGQRWLVEIERGGIGYNRRVVAYDMSRDGRTAVRAADLAFPSCTALEGLLSR